MKSELSNNAMCGLAGVCVVMVSSNSSAGVPMPKFKEIKLDNFAIQFHSNRYPKYQDKNVTVNH